LLIGEEENSFLPEEAANCDDKEAVTGVQSSPPLRRMHDPRNRGKEKNGGASFLAKGVHILRMRKGNENRKEELSFP